MKRRVVDQLSALGQEDRLQIFRLLVRAGPRGSCVDEIRRRLKLPGSTLSHHLDALTRSGLLSPERSGRFIFYAVNCRETANLIRFLTEDCCADMYTRLAAPARPEAPAGQSGRTAACLPEVSRSSRRSDAGPRDKPGTKSRSIISHASFVPILRVQQGITRSIAPTETIRKGECYDGKSGVD